MNMNLVIKKRTKHCNIIPPQKVSYMEQSSGVSVLIQPYLFVFISVFSFSIFSQKIDNHKHSKSQVKPQNKQNPGLKIMVTKKKNKLKFKNVCCDLFFLWLFLK